MSLELDFHWVKAQLLVHFGQRERAEKELLQALNAVSRTASSLTELSGREAWSEENSQFYRWLISQEIADGHPESALAVWELYLGAGAHSRSIGEMPSAFVRGNELRRLTARL